MSIIWQRKGFVDVHVNDEKSLDHAMRFFQHYDDPISIKLFISNMDEIKNESLQRLVIFCMQRIPMYIREISMDLDGVSILSCWDIFARSISMQPHLKKIHWFCKSSWSKCSYRIAMDLLTICLSSIESGILEEVIVKNICFHGEKDDFVSLGNAIANAAPKFIAFRECSVSWTSNPYIRYVAEGISKADPLKVTPGPFVGGWTWNHKRCCEELKKIISAPCIEDLYTVDCTQHVTRMLKPSAAPSALREALSLRAGRSLPPLQRLSFPISYDYFSGKGAYSGDAETLLQDVIGILTDLWAPRTCRIILDICTGKFVKGLFRAACKEKFVCEEIIIESLLLSEQIKDGVLCPEELIDVELAKMFEVAAETNKLTKFSVPVNLIEKEGRIHYERANMFLCS